MDDAQTRSIAADIAQGVSRLMARFDFVSVTEMGLVNSRRADLCALGPKGEIRIAEIKSSIADFKSDNKWHEYAPFCDRFYFAVGHDFPQDLIPQSAGLIIADKFGGAILREPAEHKLSAARRKAMTLRFGRLATRRLMNLQRSLADAQQAEPMSNRR
ncbi:MAG: MmcB family DNA repair protein [Hyphomonadaceae bacterium]